MAALRLTSTMKKIWLALSLALPFLFVLTNNEVRFHFYINNNNHTNVFSYLSKPENLPALNPTIYKLEIVGRTENEFYVEYEECLSHFSVITNFGSAHYKLTEKEDGRLELISSHSTCFVGKYICLPTFSSVRVEPRETSGVLYVEDIKYICPWILNNVCLAEIFFQRMAIMNHLDEQFSDYKP